MIVDGLLERPAALIDFAARQAAAFAPVWGPDGGFPASTRRRRSTMSAGWSRR